MSKSAADPNTQLLEGSHNMDTETLVIVRNTKDKIDINPKEKIIKATANKIQLSTTHNSIKKIPTKALNPVIDSLDIEAQVTALEKCKKKVHL